MYKHLLIVDDHEDILFFLEQGIRQVWPNFIVTTAKNGYEALRHLSQTAVDLMIIDYYMPGMDGLELAKTVRRIAPATRIVMMSSIEPPLIDESQPYDGFLDKPFGISAIQPFLSTC
ncbi:MAG TPA: response regulator [Anaerolineae bacterium]|nr:response regulator [Anaerolineae bacterium]HMR62400.1 response regulator [Anaerolineae bacterium]